MIFGALVEMVGISPVVTIPSSSSQMKILPVGSQSFPVVSARLAVVLPSSLRPDTAMVNVCSFPSQSRGSQGVSSIWYSLRSNASIPTTGLQNAGLTPPVNTTGKGHCTPANIPST